MSLIKKSLKVIGITLLFIVLTILSQVGGIILLLWLLIYTVIKKRFSKTWIRRSVNLVGFVVFYIFFIFAIIPPLAGLQDRVPLPLSKSGGLAPVSYWTAIFCRNYVKSHGRDRLEKIAAGFVSKHPNLKVKYMDCNYPFIIDVPGMENALILVGLVPHISHDGTKADIAFIYNDSSGRPSNLTPTSIGYGSSVDPLKNESCTPCICDKKNWNYSLMYRNMSKSNYELNIPLNKELILNFRREFTGQILIEKHLQQRFGLGRGFGEAGCHSVRHDDHFHVTLCN